MGGSAGECEQFLLNPETREQKVLHSKLSNFIMKKGEILRVVTAGGGGFGPAIERDLDLVIKDYLSGKISNKQLRDDYGVVLTNAGTVDYLLTSNLRKIQGG